jgi:hypothetical protein
MNGSAPFFAGSDIPDRMIVDAIARLTGAP